jgi:hypothetical protein
MHHRNIRNASFKDHATKEQQWTNYENEIHIISIRMKKDNIVEVLTGKVERHRLALLQHAGIKQEESAAS